MGNGLMRPLGQGDDFFAVEQPFDEPVQFLETNQTVSARFAAVGFMAMRVSGNGWLRF
jgi:hypothetical protein